MSGHGVIEAEARWAQAILRRDGRVMKFLLHPSFVFVGLKTAGLATWNRQEWIAACSEIQFEALDHTVRDLQVFSCVAVATIDGRWRGTVRGRTVDERFLMTDVWNRGLNGAWQVVRRHSSRFVEGEDGAVEDAPRLMLNVEHRAAPSAPAHKTTPQIAPDMEDVFL